MAASLSGPDRMLVTDSAAFAVEGAEPGERVEVDVRCDYGLPFGVWRSHAVFLADDDGCVDVAADQPIAGTWTAPDPFGAWWSMERVEEPSTTTLPYAVVATSVSVTIAGGTALRHDTVRARWRRSVTSDETQVGPLPTRIARPLDPTATNTGVVVVGGSGGGFPAVDWLGPLASRGAIAAAVGYFRLPGVPAELVDIDIEPVVATIRNLRDHFTLDRVIVVGISRGSELALLCSAHDPDSACCAVAYVPSGVVNVGLTASGPARRSAWRIGGASIPTWAWTPDGPIDPDDPSVIPTERIRGHVVTFVAGDDQLWPSERLIAPALERRRGAADGARSGDVHRVYGNAGHTFCGYPGLPVLEPASSIHPVTEAVMTMGGSRLGNAAAIADSWTHVTALVDRHVTGSITHT